MFTFKVLAHPLNKVILENALNNLVKQVQGDELIDIGIGEMFGERLGRVEFGSLIRGQ